MFEFSSDVCKSAKSFMNVIKNRRTIYDIGSDIPVPKNFVVSIVQDAIKHVPSSFNSQTNRAVVIFGKKSCYIWENIVWDFIKTSFPSERHSYFEGRMNNFKAGAGTILFYIDTAKLETYQAKFPHLKDALSRWAHDSSAMAQFAVWNALSGAKIGASLQHFVDLAVQTKIGTENNIPSSWKITALMPFGSIKAPAGEKTFVPIEESVKVYGLDDAGN